MAWVWAALLVHILKKSILVNGYLKTLLKNRTSYRTHLTFCSNMFLTLFLSQENVSHCCILMSKTVSIKYTGLMFTKNDSIGSLFSACFFQVITVLLKNFAVVPHIPFRMGLAPSLFKPFPHFSK